jgi:hypothetical protein
MRLNYQISFTPLAAHFGPKCGVNKILIPHKLLTFAAFIKATPQCRKK